MKKFYKDMSVARSIGVLLVVLGHSFPDNSYGNTSFYVYLHNFIYSFHMPFFFALSGFFASKIYTLATTDETIGFISSKVTKLIIPYFFVSILAVPVKLLMKGYTARPLELSNVFRDIFLIPVNNPVEYLWFIYTLFLIFIFAILLAKTKLDIKVIVLLTLALNILQINNISYFNLSLVANYLVYFYIGMLFRRHYNIYENYKNKNIIFVVTLVIFLIMVFAPVGFRNIYISGIYRFIRAMMGVVVFITLSYMIKDSKTGSFLQIFEKYAYDIYLFSWFFQTASRVLFYQILNLNYNFTFILMFLFGLLPIVLSKYFLRKQPIISRLFLGIK